MATKRPGQLQPEDVAKGREGGLTGTSGESWCEGGVWDKTPASRRRLAYIAVKVTLVPQL